MKIKKKMCREKEEKKKKKCRSTSQRGQYRSPLDPSGTDGSARA